MKFLVFCTIAVSLIPILTGQEDIGSCDQLLLGQYLCLEPIYDPETQQPAECDPILRTVSVECIPAPGVQCDSKQFDGKTVGFNKKVPCKLTKGKSFETALLLSIFLGMFGLDRLYLGYPALALLKFCTLGFMFVGQLVDTVLIAMQIVKPADGSDYVIDYYGARLMKVDLDNDTFVF